MAVTIRRAVLADAAPVLRSLSGQARAELAAAGVDPWEMVQESFSRGDTAFLAETGGVPLLLFGLQDWPDRVGLWSLSTVAYFSGGAPMIRTTRRFFHNLVTPKPLYAATAAPHRDTDRWLKLLGFRKESQTGIVRVFRLAR